MFEFTPLAKIVSLTSLDCLCLRNAPLPLRQSIDFTDIFPVRTLPRSRVDGNCLVCQFVAVGKATASIWTTEGGDYISKEYLPMI